MTTSLPDRERLLDAYTRMVQIRMFEDAAGKNFADGLSTYWSAAKSVLSSGADFMTSLTPFIQDALNKLARGVG